MKTKFLILLVLSTVMITGFSKENTGRKKRDKIQTENKERTEMLMNSRTFVFHARRALPAGMNSIDLTSNPAYVIFKPDFVESYLPFFGRAYSDVGYSGDTGLHFQGKPEDYKVNKLRKNYQVTASVKNEKDNFRLALTVSPGGSASLTVISNNRESICYSGEVREK